MHIHIDMAQYHIHMRILAYVHIDDATHKHIHAYTRIYMMQSIHIDSTQYI